MKKRDTLNAYIQWAIRDNWDLMALSDFDGIQLQYRDVARKIAKLHILYKKAGIKPGDKIAICGKNSSHWAVAFLATVTYGAVAATILHDFTSESVEALVAHSDAKILFTDKTMWQNLKAEKLSGVHTVIDLYNYSVLYTTKKNVKEARYHLNMLFGEEFPERFTADDVIYEEFTPNTPAVINYTSGSTGSPKGVILSHRALWSNLQYCIDGLTFLKPGDGVVCMLPLAHMFGLMVDLLHCFTKGCHIHFITRLPTPRVLLGALAEVKPKLVVSVPLVIEKIIRNNVFPKLKTNAMRIGLKLPVVKEAILKQIHKSIINAFGGKLQQIIIGGASLSSEVEEFLRSIKFPFTVGYGMTECAPLIAYAPWDVQRPQSCGSIVDRMECKIDSPDPENTPGVLWVKGDNVMDGYYKNPDATDAVFNDGWMSTGDICTRDADGFIYIRGRAKTMILGPSGQNIYPEEIEQMINMLPGVGESLVISEGGKLVALIYPDKDDENIKAMTPVEIDKAMDNNISTLNSKLPAYSKIAEKRIMKEEFKKTPKRSIKRYEYQTNG